MSWKHLWKFAATDKQFMFLEESSLPEAGFQSVYSIPEEEASALSASDDYSGYRGVVSGGSSLWVDCDDDASAEAVESSLRQLRLAFSIWETGNRGKHFQVARASQPSPSLPQIDKAWVTKHCPGADLRLYSHLHLLRRPGAVHSKTGKPKRLATTVEGTVLDLTNHVAEQPKFHSRTGHFQSVFTDPEILSLSVPHYDGQRHQMFLRLAMSLAITGQNLDFIYDWLRNVNELGDPWPEEKVRAIAEWAYAKAVR